MTIAALRADALGCFTDALAAVEPTRLVARALMRQSGAVVLRDADGAQLARHLGPVRIVGAGKAVAGMAAAAVRIAGDAVAGGLVIAPHGVPVEAVGPLSVRTAAHPVPDRAGLEATAALLAAVAAADARTLVLVLLSGGASALMAAPSPGLTLADEAAVTRALVAAGAEIGLLNAVRKHCSCIKGGGLARAAVGAAGLWTLVLSDVVGDDLSTVASGPTVADPTTYADAIAALARAGVVPPPRVAAHLERGAAGAIAETVKPGDPCLAHTRGRIVGSNRDAVEAAAAAAATRGYSVVVWPEALRGDAAEAGRRLAHALAAQPRARRVAVVAGGETTVRAVSGGRGGRSQHLALAAAPSLAGMPAVLLAAGTDGVDGPTPAAGACVDGETPRRLREAGWDLEAALAATDSHCALTASGDCIVTGPTGTNVADVVVALRAPA